MPFKYFFALILALSISFQLFGQKEITVSYIVEEEIPKTLLPEQQTFQDSTSLFVFLEDHLRSLYNQGLLEASVDQLIEKDSIWLVELHYGPVYKVVDLVNGNVPDYLLNGTGFRAKSFRNKPFSFERIIQLQEAILQEAEDNGYPFATVFLDSIRIGANEIEAALFIELNQIIRWNEISIEGEVNLSDQYLEKYLGISKEEPFSLSKFKRIQKRISELSFVRLGRQPELSFTKEEADVNLVLNKRRASRFDFIIGFLPNSQLEGRFQLTGSFDGELQNAFGQGERLFAKFEQLRPESQLLELAFNYPYVLKLPFGTDFRFNLYRRDTTFLDVELNLGLQYLLEGNNYIKFYWSNRSSNLLAINDALLLATQQLPPQLDVSYPAFGLEFNWQNLDYRFNPRKGWAVLLNGNAGTKRIRRNSNILELDLGFLYDSLDLRSSQFRLQLNTEAFLPLFPNTTLKGSVQSAFIFSDQDIYQNEQYRLGGNRLMRGFDEDFFFATQYAISTLEFRLLIDTNSFLYLFGDYGWLLDETATQTITNRALGFGAGISFETRVGVFGISLAFGRLENVPLDLSSPKVHFGYVSRF